MGLIVFLPIYFITSAFAPKSSGFGFGMGFAIFIPVIYAIFGFIFVAIGCAIYNWVASMVGGIEIQLDASESGS